jgi:hypothetical protein
VCHACDRPASRLFLPPLRHVPRAPHRTPDLEPGRRGRSDWLAGVLLVPEAATIDIAHKQCPRSDGAAHHAVSEHMIRWRMNMTGAVRRVALVPALEVAGGLAPRLARRPRRLRRRRRRSAALRRSRRPPTPVPRHGPGRNDHCGQARLGPAHVGRTTPSPTTHWAATQQRVQPGFAPTSPPPPQVRRGQRDWHGGGSTRARLHLLRASRRR